MGEFRVPGKMVNIGVRITGIRGNGQMSAQKKSLYKDWVFLC